MSSKELYNKLTINEQQEMFKYLKKAYSSCPDDSFITCNNDCLDCWMKVLYENIERE